MLDVEPPLPASPDRPAPEPPGTLTAPLAEPPGPPETKTGSRLAAIGEMALCSSLPSQLLISWLLAKAGFSPLRDNGQLVLGFVAALSFLDTAVLVALMVFFMRRRGEQPSRLWLGTAPIYREAVTGLLHVPIVFLLGTTLLLAMRALTPQLHNVDVNPFETLAGGSTLDAVLLLLVAIVAGGLREELQRAFLLDRFERHLGPGWLGVVILSTAFGLGHLLQGRDAAVATGAMGAFWAVVYLRRRSSVAPIVSHAAFNSVEVLRIIVLGVTGRRA